MKKYITVVIVFLMLTCSAFSQKVDSATQARFTKFFDSVSNVTSVSTFRDWLYKNTTAEKYFDFFNALQVFANQEFSKSAALKPTTKQKPK